MPATRRQFLSLSLAAGAAAALGSIPGTLHARQNGVAKGGGKRILILGGTGFLGPATVEAALERGHTLTLFNRGQTEKRTGNTFEDDDRIQILRGDRDPDKGDGLSAIAKAIEQGQRWDAVIDNSGYYPRIVRSSAEALREAAKQYIFISSISVYASNAEPGADESAAVGTMEDPTLESMGDQYQYYGPLKALCEQTNSDVFGDRATNVRPGYIVGPGDPTPRFTYWPVRVARGGETLAPGTADDPVQLIDVRDLGGWLIKLVEDGTGGAFNATGPAKRLTVGQTLAACKAASQSDATFVYADAEFLRENGLIGGALPIFIPPVGDYAGFHQNDISRALKAGLTFRPIEQTARDTLAWFKDLPNERRTRLTGAFLAAEREAELLGLLREHANQE